MKDSADATNYIAQHAVFHEHLLDVGAPWGETDAIFHMLMGLPQMLIWQQFKSLLKQCMNDESMVATPATGLTFTFNSGVSQIMSEAAWHIVTQHAHSSCPGSEYANTATTSTVNSTNSITRLQMHKHNPQDIFCTTPGCHKGDYDYAHYYGKGGRMEGQVPWMKNKKKKSTVAAAVVITPTPSLPLTFPPVPAIAAAVANLSSLMENLSFTSIAELSNEMSCSINLPFTTILDSGTTVTLIKDRHFFHTYSTMDTVSVHTANHSILQTTGRGNCVAWLTIDGQ